MSRQIAGKAISVVPALRLSRQHGRRSDFAEGNVGAPLLDFLASGLSDSPSAQALIEKLASPVGWLSTGMYYLLGTSSWFCLACFVCVGGRYAARVV